jgi:hypothetical protein
MLISPSCEYFLFDLIEFYGIRLGRIITETRIFNAQRRLSRGARACAACAPREHEIYIVFFRVFALSCFRDNFVFFSFGLAGYIQNIRRFRL